jgi:CRP-like cAMP-binding protein
MAYTLAQNTILWPNIFWSLLFASVNSYKIYQIFDERNASVSMTEEEEKIFVDFFMPHGVTPKQFERIEKSGKMMVFKKGELLIQKGEKPHSVYLIVEGSTNALILGRRLTAASTTIETRGGQKEGGDSGAWVGEMAFLKQFWEKEQRSIIQQKEEKAASTDTKEKAKENANPNVNVKPIPTGGGIAEAFIYSIIATEDCTVMSWSHKEMEDLMTHSTDLRAALTRAMSSALVGKVVNLAVSRTHHDKVPWLEWLKDWKHKDGTTVEIRSDIRSDHFRLAEDRL